MKRSRPERSGAKRPGPKSLGAKRSWCETSDPKRPGTKLPGPKCQGAKHSGPKSQGVKRPSPKCQGAKCPVQNVRVETSCPKSLSPKSPGAKTLPESSLHDSETSYMIVTITEASLCM